MGEKGDGIMKKWTIEQVDAARVNEKLLMDCEPWMQEMFAMRPP